MDHKDTEFHLTLLVTVAGLPVSSQQRYIEVSQHLGLRVGQLAAGSLYSPTALGGLQPLLAPR